MPSADLPLPDCRAFRPELPVPVDFDSFWARTLGDVPPGGRDKPGVTLVDTGLTQVRTYDVAFAGHGGQTVRGWLRMPTGATEPLGCVIEFLGYGRGRGPAHQDLLWACAGYAHLVMDTRGQGWSAASGATADPDPGAAGAVPGFATRGIESPDTYYYRRVFVDAVRCVEMMRGHPEIDPARVVVTGISQGGGIALAVAGLVPGLAGVMPDVPFLCNIPRGARVGGLPPYTEIASYLRLHHDRTDMVFRTLSYFDAALHAARATAPALFSIAMMDEICPPSTCFTAYNHYAGPKDLRVYEFNGHEGGGERHRAEQLAWVRSLFAGLSAGRTATS
ncbi:MULTISPECIES: acetylxylan esterase [Streptomyces]|uniref:Cephalosporin-C deacetylase n=1 Tax=Streptomyces clavifer TaxID=68188 RepID=A0ABS4V2U1_9ACTN|nr:MULTISPECIES: acetylxylan esterase [Streptomyces]MBP2358191.1 cephalosporin-C deacetylase [Streptomyces clavifer]MDX2742148.1 acetylxylan esterase [Streptomyces sp. NRRL_B-2557]GHA89175.1 acetylxylan esterase [Streptomyces clavifer]